MENICKTEIYDLRVNDLCAPMGIDRLQPTFRWKMRSGAVGARQTAYALSVTDERGKTVWDTGWVESDRSVAIRYQGKALESATEYTVSLKVKDQNGQELAPLTTRFEMGLLGADPLAPAQWITIDEADASPRQEGNLPVYRKSFPVKKDIAKARLYASALGVYESYINGQRVGRLLENGETRYEELKPGYTQMEDRKFYSTFDVTHLLCFDN